MGYWGTRGLRGSTLEEIVNYSNELYQRKGLALIQKIPTPITPIEVDNNGRRITLAYFNKQSTVDYIGAAQGVPICFDAKETKLKSLPLKNIHEHQIEFMENFRRQKGVAFLLVHFIHTNEYFFMPIETLKAYWEQSRAGGRKSIPYSAFEKKYCINSGTGAALDYLEAVNAYLLEERR